MTGGLSVEGKPENFVYVSGEDCSPDSVLLVSRIELAKGSEMKTVDDLKQYVVRNMGKTGSTFEDLADEDGISTRELKVGQYEALEIVHVADAGPFNAAPPAIRALTVLGGDFVLVVVMMNLDGGDAGTPVLWAGLVGSLDIDPPITVLDRILLYGGLGLGGLILLLFVMRQVRTRGRVRWQGAESGGGVVLSTEGWGRSATLDGGPAGGGVEARTNSIMNEPLSLPAMSDPATPGASTPGSSTPGAPSAPGVPGPAGAPAGLTSAMPSHPTHGALPPRGAPAPGTPAPAPAPGTPKPSETTPPGVKGMPEPPRRSGLVRTLPPNGKWSGSA